MSKQDLQWQAEGDARVMAQYQEIMNDRARKNRAIKEAEKQAQDMTKRANAMRSAASLGSKTSGRSTGRKK